MMIENTHMGVCSQEKVVYIELVFRMNDIKKAWMKFKRIGKPRFCSIESLKK